MTSTRTNARGGIREAAAEAMAAEPVGDLAALGAELTRLRLAALLSPSELADRAGLSQAVIRRYERGTAGPVDLGDLRAIAATLGTTAGALVDAPPPGARRGPLVLLPTRLGGVEHSATVWRLVQYLPRQLGQRWERTDQAEPGRTVSRYVLDWSTELVQTRVQVFGSASELTGQRSWYVGPSRHPAPIAPAVGRRP